MRWHAGPNAGFTAPGTYPWLPLGPDTSRTNVAAQANEPRSMLTLTRTLLTLRRAYPALAIGAYHPLDDLPDGVLGYLRLSHDTSPDVLVLLNFTATERTLDPDRPPLCTLPRSRQWLLPTTSMDNNFPSRISGTRGCPHRPPVSRQRAPGWRNGQLSPTARSDVPYDEPHAVMS